MILSLKYHVIYKKFITGGYKMEWVNSFVTLITFFLLWLFIKKFLPSYMDEKGKNLATKEDITEITRKTEEVQDEFRKKFEEYSSDLKFKYDYYYKQYAELYSTLYAIICQSEYVRRIIELHDNTKITFDDAPFIEITPTRKTHEKNNLFTGEIVERTETINETVFSKFDKKKLCELIISNGDLATQQLLKLSVSYRFAYHHYSGNPEVKNSEMQDTANEEEFSLIKKIICCIVKEYNFFRKELKMDFCEEELVSGILKINI